MAEPQVRTRRSQVADPAQEREDWLRLLDEFVDNARAWSGPDWSTRVIEKSIHDPVLGDYDAPGLLMQREFTRIIIEPVTRFPLGADGVVDLYLLPAGEDIATIVRVAGEWRIHHVFRGEAPVVGIKNIPPVPWDQANLIRVLDSISGHAS